MYNFVYVHLCTVFTIQIGVDYINSGIEVCKLGNIVVNRLVYSHSVDLTAVLLDHNSY